MTSTTLQVRVSEPRPGRTQYAYELRSGSGSLMGPLEQEHTVPVSQDLVKGLCKAIDETLRDDGADPQSHAGLVRLGGQLYDALFPQTGRLDLVRRLRESTGPLMVQSNESLVPWELLHDEQEFLGLRHDMGRRARVEGPVVSGRTSNRIGRALVVGDTLGDLASAREETARISAWLTERGVECTVLTGARATLIRIVGELADKTAPYDLFHYSGHVSGVPGAAGLLVHDRKFLGHDALQPLARRGAPPIVFINGCASADPTLDSGSRALAESAQTMSACMSFMLMGAKTVVGTRTPVGDASALRFAEAFYGQLRDEVEAGAAVRKARAELAEGHDGTWASFVLYGDPGVRIVAAPEPPPEEQKPPRPGYTPQALDLLRRATRFGAMRGIITSVDLLTALLDTDEIRERAAARVGTTRLHRLTELLREVQSHTPVGAGADHDGGDDIGSGGGGGGGGGGIAGIGAAGDAGAVSTGRVSAGSTSADTVSTGSISTDTASTDTASTGSDAADTTPAGAATTSAGVSASANGSSVNGSSRRSDGGRMAFSDTIAQVVEGADAAALADGRDKVGVDDIALAFLATGGGNCAKLLRLCGVRPELLLAPGVASAGPPGDAERILDLSALGDGAAAAVRSARMLAAIGEKRISSSLLLRAFAVAGSDVLRDALAEQGEQGRAAFDRLARLDHRPRRREFYSRTRHKLERLSAQAAESGTPVGEEALLLELLAEGDSTACKMLRRLGVEPEAVTQVLRERRGAPEAAPPVIEAAPEVTDEVAAEVTAEATPPVIEVAPEVTDEVAAEARDVPTVWEDPEVRESRQEAPREPDEPREPERQAPQG
ncbi:CHAT domain-containing protein [Streptomyces beihaiensis]|uniref:CHAT domain-containing protein n=1 Tax=Streptomyces beihaiensis TaxID=2984495 RepID=A0ABT3TRL3_9ACTN|nr:CHAT domain-containing protein [Streptomyces beihaiensis]MCX3059661.1 CHAT domain-containing protein [Streptomyces beihaiensis]